MENTPPPPKCYNETKKLSAYKVNKRESMLFAFKRSRLCEKFHSGTLQFRIFSLLTNKTVAKFRIFSLLTDKTVANSQAEPTLRVIRSSWLWAPGFTLWHEACFSLTPQLAKVDFCRGWGKNDDVVWNKTLGTLSNTTHPTGRGGQFSQLISLSPGNTYQLKELAATSCWRRRLA